MHKLLIIAVLSGLIALGTVACVAPYPVAPVPAPVNSPAEPTDADTEATLPAMATAESVDAIPIADEISGFVFDADGPVKNATVRIQATEIMTTTGDDGAFKLVCLAVSEPPTLTVTAWSLGYYGGAANALPGDDSVTIDLLRYSTEDNVDYQFAPSETCGECHPSYLEWQQDAHALSATNPRFLTLYQGTDVHGNRTRVKRDAAGLPLPLEPGQPDYGPGLRIDYPDRTGNCAACHTPAASNLETTNTCGWAGCHTNFTAQMSDEVPYGVNPSDLKGVAAEGMSCDFCHKIGNVILNPQDDLPWAARPGVTSLQLFRPEEGHDLFLGSFDDVSGHDSFLPLQEESAFCAPCHHGIFGGVAGSHDMAGGVAVYDSYGEWLDSPYSDPETGQTCQNCHMPSVDYAYYVYPEKGGLERDPKRIHNHLMPGIGDEYLMQNAVSMETSAKSSGDQVSVEVSISNDQTGHHVPTGTPLRQMLLVVTASDSEGNRLALVNGPVLPGWTGDLAGQAGHYYVKVLKDRWSGEAPTAAYWREIELVEDTRLAAFETDTNHFTFAAPDGGPVTVEARLLYRRAPQELMIQKGWTDPDIIMEETTIVVPVSE
ncbi:MAG: hypothetical protein U9R25_10120 [Chloroflexota bacterium]|nr:hypothetical protein [Chloroflexota bacterium]